MNIYDYKQAEDEAEALWDAYGYWEMWKYGGEWDRLDRPDQRKHVPMEWKAL